MNPDVNPFQVLYVTDSPDPRAFVDLFSDYPVKFSHPIFQQGNVVLKGTQGSGKSMLLNLLRPQIRLAYAKANANFPVPPPLRRFVSAGINLTLSGALDIGQRPLSKDQEHDESLFPLLFADFLNYYVVRDLMRSLDIIGQHPDVFEKVVHKDMLDDFAKTLASDDCWFGYLENTTTFEELRHRLDRRLASYRSFHQFNSDLPDDIKSTKTNVSDPIARAEEALKTSGAVQNHVPLFVRIDQLERLYRSDVLRPNLGPKYRQLINKALSKRDSRVSFRVGTRRYAWEDDLLVFGTQDRLEHLRDYRLVDLDDKMRRKEDAKTWLFPEFAADAFRRRLRLAGFAVDAIQDPLQVVFGTGQSPEEAAFQYASNADACDVLKLDQSWPESWSTFLKSEFAKDPFSALLASAWARQKGGTARPTDRRHSPPPADSPWNRPYWRKERVRQCLMQLAARRQQRLRWSGKDAILALSTPNISVFLSVCHEIWDAFLRSEQRKAQTDRSNPLSVGIHSDIQTVGIHTASEEWHDKIAEQPHGHDRQRFVDFLGRSFRKWMLDDIAMSYPGHNGFSVELDELRRVEDVARFLQDAADYGDLYDAEHTTKTEDRRQRRKWYLSPILSAFFQIPEAHPKEPKYVGIADIIDWLVESGVNPPDVVAASFRGRRRTGMSDVVRGQGLLFPDAEDQEEEL